MITGVNARCACVAAGGAFAGLWISLSISPVAGADADYAFLFGDTTPSLAASPSSSDALTNFLGSLEATIEEDAAAGVPQNLGNIAKEALEIVQNDGSTLGLTANQIADLTQLSNGLIEINTGFNDFDEGLQVFAHDVDSLFTLGGNFGHELTSLFDAGASLVSAAAEAFEGSADLTSGIIEAASDNPPIIIDCVDFVCTAE
jgi:uncharacterized protein (UPF0147 family)